MNTTVLRGKPVATKIKEKLQKRINFLLKKNIIPSLSVILIGNDPASEIYVKTKHKTFIENNCKSDIYKFPNDVTENEVISLINQLNIDKSVHGILLQLPISNHLDTNNIINVISPEKDVDGLHPYNLGKLLNGNPDFIPCTPLGCLKIIEYYNIKVANQYVVIIGRSNIVGKPLLLLLSQKFKVGNATVTICHTGTRDLATHTKKADIIIAAAGVPNLINSSMIKKNCHIIDVGINRIKDNSERGYYITGDVDYEDSLNKASSITPVPGGVGPLTISMLLNNTVQSAESLIT